MLERGGLVERMLEYREILPGHQSDTYASGPANSCMGVRRGKKGNTVKGADDNTDKGFIKRTWDVSEVISSAFAALS